jgi:hypothetical protein
MGPGSPREAVGSSAAIVPPAPFDGVVQGDAEGPDVGRGGGLPVVDLLGGQVGGSGEQGAAGGEGGFLRYGGEPEVGGV